MTDYFNFLVHDINRRIAKTVPCRGMVIDLGCGTAPYKNYLLQKATAYIGLDWKKPLCEKQCVDIVASLKEQLPLKAEVADTVVAFQVMEHLPEPDLFLSECRRILKPGGSLFITVPFMWQVHEEPHDYYRYTRYGLAYLLEKHRFANIEIKETTGFWQMIILKCNYHSVKFSKGLLKYFLIPFWFAGQILAPVLDKYDQAPNETISYLLKACKTS